MQSRASHRRPLALCVCPFRGAGRRQRCARRRGGAPIRSCPVQTAPNGLACRRRPHPTVTGGVDSARRRARGVGGAGARHQKGDARNALCAVDARSMTAPSWRGPLSMQWCCADAWACVLIPKSDAVPLSTVVPNGTHPATRIDAVLTPASPSSKTPMMHCKQTRATNVKIYGSFTGKKERSCINTHSSGRHAHQWALGHRASVPAAPREVRRMDGCTCRLERWVALTATPA